MFAAGFAAAPAAAAATNISGSTPVDDVAVGNGAAAQTVTFTVNLEAGDSDVPVVVNLSEAADAGVTPSVTSVSGGTGITATNDGIDGANHTILLSEDNSGSAVTSGEVTVEYEHDTTALNNGDTTSSDAYSFDITDENGANGGSVSFDLVSATGSVAGSISNGVDDTDVTLAGADADDFGGAVTVTGGSGSYTIDNVVDGTYTVEADNGTFSKTEEVTVTDGSAVTGVDFDLGTVSPSYTPDSDLYYAGQDIEVDNLYAGSDYQLREVTDRDSSTGDITGSSPVEQFAASDSGEYTIDTGDLETGDYFLRGPGIGDEEATEFEVSTQSLSTDFDEDEVEEGEEVDLEIDSNRGTYSLNVSASGLDDTEIEAIFEDSGFESIELDDEDEEVVTLVDVTDGDYAANFTDVDTGEYTFDFEVTDTEAEDSASINVTEAADGEGDIADSVVEQQGDVAAITVELDNTDEGTLVIGNEDDDGYQANVTVEDDDDGEVVVLFNTYAAGSGAAADDVVYTEDDDATVSLEGETDLNDILDTGTYDISVGPYTDDATRFEDTLDDPDSISSLSIEERSETSLALWRTSESVEGDIADELDDEDENATVTLIEGAIEGDLVTETDTLAVDADGTRSDVLVHQFTASGLEGVFESADSAKLGDGDRTDQLYTLLQEGNDYADADSDLANDGDDKLEMVLELENPGPNEPSTSIDVNELVNDGDISETEFKNTFTVVYDDQTDTYYIVANADNLNSAIDEDLEDEDEYEVQLNVQDARLLDLLEEDDEDDFEESFLENSAMFTVAEAEGEFDNEDEIQVAAEDNQSITGTTNVAPGTEIDVRVRSDDDASTSFIQNDEDIVVSTNGTFEANFDFSETAVNDTFTAEVRQAAFDADSDGTVVEEVQEPATFEVSDLSPSEATATAGDSVTVSATIENTGEAEGTQDVALTLDGEELDTQEVTLAGGEDTTVEFTADTSGLDAGDYEHGIATDDDEATGTLTIEAADDGGDDGGDGDDGSDDGGDGDDGGSTDDSTPGFGALVALVALIAAALLATRRNE